MQIYNTRSCIDGSYHDIIGTVWIWRDLFLISIFSPFFLSTFFLSKSLFLVGCNFQNIFHLFGEGDLRKRLPSVIVKVVFRNVGALKFATASKIFLKTWPGQLAASKSLISRPKFQIHLDLNSDVIIIFIFIFFSKQFN